MLDHVLVGMAVLLAAVYGGPLLIGGECWLYGWRRHSDRLSKAGDVMVLVGLVTDAVLITANWLFGWVAWVGATIA